jgi:hypothetical protein
MFREQYSNYLYKTVESMLALSPNNRRKASEIYNELYPHEEQILNIEPFPEKVSYQQVRPVTTVPCGYGQNQAGSYAFQVPPPTQKVTYQPTVQTNSVKYQPYY